MSNEPQRPTTDDRDAWRQYWVKTQPAKWFKQWGHWRREPEIDEERQRFLAERRRVQPDIEHGIYPFCDENGSVKLDRADVEWLLATHESGGTVGPVDWTDIPQRARDGLDVRGADLSEAKLDGLPLARLRGGLYEDEWATRNPAQRSIAGVNLRGANLRWARLEGAALRRAHLERARLYQAQMEHADLRRAHLEAADLCQTHLGRASLAGAFLSGDEQQVTRLDEAILTDAKGTGPFLADTQWGNVNLAVVDWSPLRMLSDEAVARQRKDRLGKRKDRQSRLREYQVALRAYRQLATVLREQGLNEDSDRIAYRAQVVQRQVLRRQGMRKWPPYVGSLLLDVLAGYGYRPARSFLVYLVAIVWFANTYHLFGLPSLDAAVFSMASFHGRGFFPSEAFTLHSPVAITAAVEAFFGLLIEITFIATFTQRFFAR